MVILVNIVSIVSLMFCIAIKSSSDQYEVINGEVIWDPQSAFPIIYSCIAGYQYSINGEILANVTENSIRLDSSFTDPETCAMNVLTIQPIVAAGNFILNNAHLTGPTCDTGN